MSSKQEFLYLGLLALAVPAAAGAAQDRDVDGRGTADRARQVERLRGSEDWRTDFSIASVPLEEIVSGGPPRDGIPPIDQPKFEGAEKADEWLGPNDPVIVVEGGDDVKAYPLGILIWHEVVNDVVGDVPVAVTFCPLCNTALVFDRTLDGSVLDFGTTGRLRHSDLVMYDRQTQTWWQQAVGEAIVGELTGRRLELRAANTLGWERARTLYPDIAVLSRDTGFPSYAASGRYGQNPYRRYDSGQPYARFYGGRPAEDLPAMERVVAIDSGEGWAVGFSALREQRVLHDEVEGRPIAVFWAAGAASALDETRIAGGRDVGQTAVFDRRVESRTLRFRPGTDGRFIDEATGSVWNLAGRAVAGPLAGRQLEPVPHGNHFWFAWTAFRPETEIVRPGRR